MANDQLHGTIAGTIAAIVIQRAAALIWAASIHPPGTLSLGGFSM